MEQEIDLDSFDPKAPFIGSDGLEYEDFAARLVGKPADCWRNAHIEDLRSRGVAEEHVQAWIKAYDGDDPTPSITVDAEARQARLEAANKASPRARSSIFTAGQRTVAKLWASAIFSAAAKPCFANRHDFGVIRIDTI